LITLTFDDALLNTYEVAFPIMERCGFKGVAFIPTGILTGEVKKVRVDDSPYMSLNQVKDLHSAGWEIGSHSVTHPRFDLIPEKKAIFEIEGSKNFLETSGFNPASFAFPYGHGYYLPHQVRLAYRNYRWVRSVCDGRWGLIDGIPIEDFPPKTDVEGLWKVYVIHLIRDPKAFESWICNVDEEITFREAEKLCLQKT